MKLKLLFAVVVSFLLSSAVSAQDVPVNMQLAKGYLLGPGDEITGKVLGEPQFDFVATVNDDGKIEVPFFDKPVVAKCRTERQLRTDVTALLEKYLKTPQLSLRVTDRKSRQPATVYGEVRLPQQVVLMRKATLAELIAFSGGVTEDAGGMIQVFRTQPPICSEYGEDSNWKATAGDPTDVPSRMYSLASVNMGKEDSNPVIYPGDLIVVLRAKPVYITGEVVAPQGVYLKEGGTLAFGGNSQGRRRQARGKNEGHKDLSLKTKFERTRGSDSQFGSYQERRAEGYYARAIRHCSGGCGQRQHRPNDPKICDRCRKRRGYKYYRRHRLSRYVLIIIIRVRTFLVSVTIDPINNITVFFVNHPALYL